MEFPGLDVKSLSDEDIYKRIGELNAKLLFVHYSTGNQEMVDQLQALLETLQFEQMERMSKKTWDKQWSDSPVVVETDPDLAPDARKASAKKDVDQKANPHSPFLPKRTKKPTDT